MMNEEEMKDYELLQYGIKNNIINLAGVREKYEMSKNAEYLAMHTYAITLNKDGYWRTKLKDETRKDGRLTIKKRTREEVEQAVIQFYKEQEENPTIDEVFKEWNSRRLELHKIKKSTYDKNRQVYNKHYKKFGKRRIKAVSPEEISDFLEEEIANHGLSAKSFGNLKSITNGFLKRAKKRKLITYNVTELFDELDVSEADFKKKHKTDAEEVFTEEEYPRVMNYLIENPDMYNLGFLLIFVTGLRIGELVALKWEDYDGISLNVCKSETRYTDDAGKLVYEVSEPKTEAGYRTVVIPRDYTWIMERLRAMNPFTEYIFSERGKRIHTYNFRNRLTTICKKTGCVIKSHL